MIWKTMRLLKRSIDRYGVDTEKAKIIPGRQVPVRRWDVLPCQCGDKPLK